MADERYRIRADQLDDYAGHPEGVELATEHDTSPPQQELPIRVSPLSDASAAQAYGQISSVAHGPAGGRRRAARGFAYVVLALFAVNVLWQLLGLLKG